MDKCESLRCKKVWAAIGDDGCPEAGKISMQPLRVVSNNIIRTLFKINGVNTVYVCV